MTKSKWLLGACVSGLVLAATGCSGSTATTPSSTGLNAPPAMPKFGKNANVPAPPPPTVGKGVD